MILTNQMKMIFSFFLSGIRGHWRLFCLIVLLQLLPPMASSSGSLVRSLPGFTGNLPFRLETGYIGVGEAEEVQLFYLFVESQRNPSQDPVLFWQIGGPGCSALSAFFFENGPLIFDGNYSGELPKLELNPFAWTQVLNIIFVDLPVGTGFSYSKTEKGYYSSDTIWVEHAYEFLTKWFIEHPNFSVNPFYIGGGSYSGIPIPPLVLKVYEGNNASSPPLMNIKGYVLSSPFVDYRMDPNFRIEYAYSMALIPYELYQSLKVSCNGDYVNINPNNTKCVSDYKTFSQLIRYINQLQILEPDIDNESPIVGKWANNEKVREALHVRKGTKGEFERCNGSLAYTKNITDVVKFHWNLTYTNLQSLIYCGDLDMGVPHFATLHWINSLNLTIAYPWRAWYVEGQVAGYTEIYERIDDYYMTYVAVKGAGHIADTYKPKEVYNMIESVCRRIESSIHKPYFGQK